MNQAGIGRAEAARVEVEGSKVGLEVDMQPLTAGGPRLTYRERDHCSADSAALPCAPSLCVEQERVVPTVPRHVHESDQCTSFFAGGDPAKAVGTDCAPPAIDCTPAMRQHEVDHLLVGDRVAPTAYDRCFHSASFALSYRESSAAAPRSCRCQRASMQRTILAVQSSNSKPRVLASSTSCRTLFPSAATARSRTARSSSALRSLL